MNVSTLLIAKKLHISPQTGVSVAILTVAIRQPFELLVETRRWICACVIDARERAMIGGIMEVVGGMWHHGGMVVPLLQRAGHLGFVPRTKRYPSHQLIICLSYLRSEAIADSRTILHLLLPCDAYKIVFM